MSSLSFSVGSLDTVKGRNTRSKKGNDSDSADSSIFQSSPTKRNRDHDQSLVPAVTTEELQHRQSLFPFGDYKSVKKNGMACAACGSKLLIQAGEEIFSHLYLQVAVCKKCKHFYGKGDFSVDEDGTDKFCRLCGNGGELFCCSSCTCVFCKKCVKRNLGRGAVKAIDDEDSWDCYICDVKPLWDLRASCWAAQQYINALKQSKKQKVKSTLVELSDKKRNPRARRELVRKKNASITDSEDEASKSNSDKENSSSDRSTKRHSNLNRTNRKLFVQQEDDLLDISQQSSGRKSLTKTSKVKEISKKPVRAVSLSSDSDSDLEDIIQNARKKSAAFASKKSDQTAKGKGGNEIRSKLRGNKSTVEGSQSNENNSSKVKEGKEDDGSSEKSDKEDSEDDHIITSKSNDSRPASSNSPVMSLSGGNGSKPTSKKSAKTIISINSDSSDETFMDSLNESKERSKKKPAFFESQAKEYNTGKRKKKKSSKCSSLDDKEKERHRSTSSESPSNSDSEDEHSTAKVTHRVRTTRRVAQEAESSDDDSCEPQGRNKKTRQKLAKIKKHKNHAAPSNTEDSGKASQVSAHIDSDSDISMASQRTEKRGEPMISKSNSKNTKSSDDLERSRSTNSASRNERGLSCEVRDSPTKSVVKKRSASADDACVVGGILSDLSKKSLNTSSNSDSENFTSDSETSQNIEKESSDKIMTYLQQQCYISNALGKSLCRVTRIIESKIKGPTDFKNTRNIDKMFSRMLRMSRSVKRNVAKMQVAFVTNYKRLRKDVRSKNDSPSKLKLENSIKKAQANLVAWEEEYRQWQEDESSNDNKAAKVKKKKVRSGSVEASTITNEVLPSTDSNDLLGKDVDVESLSLLAVANQDVETNDRASISSDVTQLYDYKKNPSSVKSKGKAKVSSKGENDGISDDMFSDTEDHTSQKTDQNKSELSKMNGSKVSSKELSDQSSDESNGNANQVDDVHAQSSDAEDFPVATQPQMASQETSVTVTEDIASKKVSGSEDEISDQKTPVRKSKSGRSLACPKSKKKALDRSSKSDSAREEDDRSDRASSSRRTSKSKDTKLGGASPACPKSKKKAASILSKSDSALEEDGSDKASSPQRKSKNNDTKSDRGSPASLSPSAEKAKALLLASSSEDEPLEKYMTKSGKSVEKSDSQSQERRSGRERKSLRDKTDSSSKKNGSSSDTDCEMDASDKVKSKKRLLVKGMPKKKLDIQYQSKLDRRLLRSYNDVLLVQTPIVRIQKLRKKQLLKYGIDHVPKMKKKGSQTKSSDDESAAVARLVNLTSAGKRNRTKHGSDSAGSSVDDLPLKKKKPPGKKYKNTKDPEADGLHSGSDGDVAESVEVSSPAAVNDELTEQELREMNNRQLKEQLLATSSDEEAAESQPSEEPKKKTPKKDPKEKTEDGEKSSTKKKTKKDKSDGDSDGEKGSGSDDSTIISKKKRAKRSKLMSLNLNMSDSSEEEAKFKAKEARIKAEKENAPATPSNSDSEEDAMLAPKSLKGKSPRKNKINSDSDASAVIVETSSSNSDDDFVIPSKKNKRKGKSSDSDSSDQKKKKTKRRRIKTPKSDSDSDVQEVDQSQNSTPGKGRKNIRKVMTEESVGEQTKRAAREEAERKKRIEEKQLLYNKLYGSPGGKKVITEKLVLDFDPETKEELVRVHDSIVRKLKPHQVRGVEFMWNVCYESVKQLEKNKGSGCILAHCMGLGKSFQVVALVHTLLVNPLTKVKTVLVVCPLSTALNWVNEFRIWLKDTKDDDEIDVYELSKYKKPIERKHKLEEWQRNGGVMVMNYELYRTLSMNNVKKLKQHIKKSWEKSLVDPGPDLVVCDEGHLLKNEDSAISKAMRKVKTLRRIVLTGTPLQNNLVEYHCMVNFVRPNLLGTRKEFLNRFVNPITNGQYEDSTAHDVKIMKRRAHVLHKMLDGIVQRYDYAELTPFLPEKQEYVISVRLSEAQTKIYQDYLDNRSGLSLLQNGSRNTRLLPDWHVFQRINTHPKVLLYHDEESADKDAEKSDDSEGRKAIPVQSALLSPRSIAVTFVSSVQLPLRETTPKFLVIGLDCSLALALKLITQPDKDVSRIFMLRIPSSFTALCVNGRKYSIKPAAIDCGTGVVKTEPAADFTMVKLLPISTGRLQSSNGPGIVKYAFRKNCSMLHRPAVAQRVQVFRIKSRPVTSVIDNVETVIPPGPIPKGSLKDFIDDDDDSTSESSEGSDSNGAPKKPAPKRRLRGDPEPEEPEKVDSPVPAVSEEWWREYCTDDVINGINSSGKLAILFSLLRECEKIGDKVLVFSQSLFSLRLIEEFLARIDSDTRRVQREARNSDAEPEPNPQLGGHSGLWVKGFDYFRLDGSINAEVRHRDCKKFNNKDDHRARLYLISTRAGGLGINLVAANRVVVFDASWNPSHDVQSIFRVFRFGQVKPCYIYRLLAYSTIEERVYERQVTKLSLSCRVVDEQQIDRHYTNKDIMAMYTFDHAHKTDRPTPILPKDRLLAELLKEHSEWIETYHEHDSLLENKADEELNEEERKAAWEEYESEKKPQISVDQYAFMLKNNVEALKNLLRSQNPDANDATIEQSIQQLTKQVEQRQAILQQQQQQRLYQYQQQVQYQALQRLQNQQMGTNPGASNAGVYQQFQQYEASKNMMLNNLLTTRQLVKIPPQGGSSTAGVPRISVRSMAEMQQPRPKAYGANQAYMIPNVHPMSGPPRTVVIPPPLPRRATTTNAAGSVNKPKDGESSGAPMSPINLD